MILNVYVDSRRLEDVVEALLGMPEVVDLYEVTGSYDVVAVVETDSKESFRSLLVKRILRIGGVKETNSSVILHVHKRAGEAVEG